MIIALASGKGGTGKTTLATAIASIAPAPVQYLDCDVEEPNGFIFLKPAIQSNQTVTVPVPRIDEKNCSLCGKCASFCQFNALANTGAKILSFPELCHNCGGCMKICPMGAIFQQDYPIGTMETGRAGKTDFLQGKLDVGRAMSPPVIREIKKHAQKDGLTVIDCPPGTSCPMITAVKGADFVLLVTEPTPFGLHDLELAVETMRVLDLPFGVIVNRADAGDKWVTRYCRSEGIPLLLEIPHSRAVAEAYSRGESMLNVLPQLEDDLLEVLRYARENRHREET